MLDGGLTMDVGDWWCVEGQCGGYDGDLTKNFEVVVVMIVTGVEGESGNFEFVTVVVVDFRW